MSRLLNQKSNFGNFLKGLTKQYSVADKIPKKAVQLPTQADVVIIGKVYNLCIAFLQGSFPCFTETQPCVLKGIKLLQMLVTLRLFMANGL